MYATCLYCKTNLGANEAVETFPIGRRLAFDSAKGRLWVVCHLCERWNLTPIETRWEAVETCERLFRDARQRFNTENIGLAHLDEGLDLVRIGKPLLPEFAAWRYGDQFGQRRKRTVILTSALGAAAAALAVGSVPLTVLALGAVGAFRVAEAVAQRVKETKLVARVPRSDGETLTVLGGHLPLAQIKTDLGGRTGWQLELTHLDGTDRMGGDHAMNAIALIMPSINGTGATARRVSRAIKRLEVHADPVGYLRSIAAISSHYTRPGDRGSLASLPVDMRMAVEMAANEENERYILAGEIGLLEMAWEEAEEIAAIADDLIVSPEIVRQLDQLKAKRPSDSGVDRT